MIEYSGLTLPDTCPACGGVIEREMRFPKKGRKQPQFTIEYECGAVLTTLYDASGTERQTNVSMGCREATRRALDGNR